MRNKLRYFIIVFFLVSNLFAKDKSERKSKVEFSGYVKDLRAAYVKTLPGKDLLLDNFIHNRLNFRWYAHKNLTIALEARNRLFYGEFVSLNPGYADMIDYNDYFNLSYTWLDKSSAVGHSILDRAFIEYSKNKFEVRLGRQRINWGITTVWNPNDIFNAFNFFDWDYEERPGSDAIRLQYYNSFASSVEFAAKMGKTIDETVIAGLWKFNKWNYDFQVLGGIARGDATLGMGWAGNIKSLGFKGEMSYFHNYGNFIDTTGSFSATFGLDYSFKKGVYVLIGGLYNSLGTSSYTGSNLLNFNVSAKNLSPFKYSLIAQASYTATPLLNVGLGAMYSPGPDALAILPSLTYNIRENWDLDLLGQLFLANVGGYQSLANVVYVRTKWSF